MAETQIVVRRGPSTVIQGTRDQIVSVLEKLGDAQEELTLIVPGRQVESNGATPSGKPKSFDEVFGTLQEGFEASGMTEEELNDFVDVEIAAYHAERRAKEQP